MLKPGANYRMSKPLKTSLALSKFQDPHKKAQWKRAMIQAEMAALIKPVSSRSRNKDKAEE